MRPAHSACAAMGFAECLHSLFCRDEGFFVFTLLVLILVLVLAFSMKAGFEDEGEDEDDYGNGFFRLWSLNRKPVSQNIFSRSFRKIRA